jgi:hypothetical protein
MVITILAPEVLITLNAGQLSNAWSCVRGLKKLAEEDGVPWTLTHSLFANMGGFVVREFTPGRMDDSLSLNTKGRQKNNGEVESQEINGAVVDTQAAENAPEGIKHAPSEGVETSPHIGNQIKPDGVEMEEINSTEEMTQSPSQILAGTKNPLYESLEGQPQPEPRAYFILAHEILELRQRGIVKLPYITKDEIMDKGKSDSLHGCSPSGRPFGSWPR